MAAARKKPKAHHEKDHLRTWIEIDRKAIAHNYKAFRGLIPKSCKFMAVVKSNAYGHNLHEFAQEMERLGADFLGVDSVVEGIALRTDGITAPILVLGHTRNARIAEAARKKVSLTVANFEALDEVITAGKTKPVRVHIKVDTGMHRQGFLEADMKALLKKLVKHKKEIVVEGLYTHFAAAKNPSFPNYTLAQIEEFDRWVKRFREEGFEPIVHAAATAGTILFPQSHYDMVRIGIGLYGYYPSDAVRGYAREKIPLKPVLTWKSVISEVKGLPAGVSVGYDLTEVLSRDTRAAILPVGYWHGYPRALSSIGHVLVDGKRARVLGRVSMDMLVVDVTNIPGAKVGSEVVLLGRDGDAEFDADEFGRLSDTSSYEVVTRLNPLMKRFFV